ncbi:trehalase-domain-containing protein [Radiomyces spectabilis]|uniref:trehalase-domain-containing protein n=1 Tax=Radiomyces spectabilis TaxID=64574 RepID=UPI0022200AED|nr:trehalase-domain-containing protein [Radiomyces spectabilis]KAI8367661.1 trehalase-domain-containing protein [Radiomyces spectabilis]
MLRFSEDASYDVHAVPSNYYLGTDVPHARTREQARSKPTVPSQAQVAATHRRYSYEEKGKPRQFLLNVEEAQREILAQEDTDNDFQITVNDEGPKVFTLGTADSGGYKKFEVRGTYMLSNLLQELTLAQEFGRKYIVLDEARLDENPVERLSRIIRDLYWNSLTRRIDADSISVLCADPKSEAINGRPRVYVPYSEDEIFSYYQKALQNRPDLNIDVERLPKDLTPEYVKDINTKPGILSLKMRKIEKPDGTTTFQGEPFIVPGGRFNEMYGWDSYFEALGLLIDNHVDIAKSMVNHFAYEITHYGKILNANRSYYLLRSEPPFLTDMALRVYERLDPNEKEANKEWLRSIFQAAIQEYETVWMAEPRLDKKTGLSRYRPAGQGIPPETEPTHFDHVVSRFARKYRISIPEFIRCYNAQQVCEPELDEYFMHDRAVRESGHDTTYRFDNVCANLATIDLNALLYKYEMDIGDTIRDHLDDDLTDFAGNKQSTDVWLDRAKHRRDFINKYLWNEEESLYFDYDTVREQQQTYESATAFWALWAGCANPEQAQKMIERSLFKLEVKGGLVSGTEKSRGATSVERPSRQWDFPFGWAPHQILAWVGLEQYELPHLSRRLAYRWLYTITKSFVDFNGVVPEKFDVVSLSHKVKVEYGNVGTDFKCVPREGFGWMNASYQIGLSYLNTQMRRALAALTDPDLLFRKALERENRQRSPSDQKEALLRRNASTLAVNAMLKDRLPEAAVTHIVAESSSPGFLSPQVVQ